MVIHSRFPLDIPLEIQINFRNHAARTEGDSLSE